MTINDNNCDDNNDEDVYDDNYDREEKDAYDVQYSWVLYFPKVKISINPSRIVLEETDLWKIIVIPETYPREIKVASSGRRYTPQVRRVFCSSSSLLFVGACTFPMYICNCFPMNILTLFVELLLKVTLEI